MLKKISLQAQPPDRGKRLDQFLAEKLPAALGESLSKSKVRLLVVAGAVYLNGKRVRIASKELLPGARIDLYVDLKKLGETRRESPFEMSAERILFEDEDLIVVDKPPGLPTQPTLDEARSNLFAAVKKFLERGSAGQAAYLGLHHRLDRDTSGVILFTKTQRANAGVARMFAEHEAQKTYQALTLRPFGLSRESWPKEDWVVKNYLGQVGKQGKRAQFGSVRSGGDYAETSFRILEASPEGLWVEARPKTGRTHQIRVHLAEAGMPILGDDVYGLRAGISRVMLHAVCLTFPHPLLNTQISVQSPLPKDFVQCLERLRSGD